MSNLFKLKNNKGHLFKKCSIKGVLNTSYIDDLLIVEHKVELSFNT